MNRQAVPSIFLSIANVCFFAVILYHHEPQARPATASGHATSDVIPSAHGFGSAANLAGGAAYASLSPAIDTEAMPRMPATGGRPADPVRKVAKASTRNVDDRPGVRER